MTRRTVRFAACVLATLVLPLPALTKVLPFPAGFRTQDIETIGATLHTRVGGQGPAVLLLHGFADTGDMWAPAGSRACAPPHGRCAGSARHGALLAPGDRLRKRAQALDIARVLDALSIDDVDLVTHDIGNMVGYAFAAQYPARVKRWVAMDAPLPGIGPWDEILKNPLLWHFNFRGPDAERLVAGRERFYLDRFYNELSADPKGIDEETRQHYAELYARPGAMHSAFNQFAAFAQDATDNRELLAKGKRWRSARRNPSARRWRTTCASSRATSPAR